MTISVRRILIMKCFSHNTVEAVAVCRSCGRALCPNCVVEVGTVCACRNRCEQQVGALNAMVVGTRSAQRGMPILLVFLLVMGVVFLYWGRPRQPDVPPDPLTLSIGGVFTLWAIVNFINFLMQRRRKR